MTKYYHIPAGTIVTRIYIQNNNNFRDIFTTQIAVTYTKEDMHKSYLSEEYMRFELPTQAYPYTSIVVERDKVRVEDVAKDFLI